VIEMTVGDVERDLEVELSRLEEMLSETK